MDGGLWYCTGGRDQDHPQEKEMQKGKMVVWGGLTIAVKRSDMKGKGEKERYTHLNSDQCKEIEENNRMGKTRDLFKKIRDTKGTFHTKGGKSLSCVRLFATPLAVAYQAPPSMEFSRQEY